MPLYSDVVDAVTTFLADYTWAIAAGTVISLLAFGVKRLIKIGR